MLPRGSDERFSTALFPILLRVLYSREVSISSDYSDFQCPFSIFLTLNSMRTMMCMHK